MPEKIKHHWLQEVCHQTFEGTIYNLVTTLSRQNLTQYDPEIDDWILCGQMTEKGFYLITDAISVIFTEIFRCSFLTKPTIMLKNPKLLSSDLIQNMEKIATTIEGNDINIKFTGPKPLINSIDSYLNPELIDPCPKIVKNIKVEHMCYAFTDNINFSNG
jgi:hypothetical protein